MLLSSLQDFSGDVLLAALALDAEHGVVVHLAVGDPILADVLGIEDLVADFTLEAAQVPMLVQCYKGLFILKLLPTATAVVDSLYGCRAVGRERLGTVLADTLLPVKCHSVTSREWLFAGGADEAARVVSLSQGGHHLPLNEVLAAEATSPVHPLIVQSADIFTLTHEKASLGQFTSTHFTDEALDVEVFVLDSECFPLAGLPTVLTGDGASSSSLLLLLLLHRAVDSLLLEHFLLWHCHSVVFRNLIYIYVLL